MERRGVYRKGSAGHARSINLYRLFRQRDHHSHNNKWRWPITAVLALMLVFGVAPNVGDEFNFQASILTADQKQELLNAEPEALKKGLVEIIKSVVDDCAKFKMEACVLEGNALMNEIAVETGNPVKYVALAERFIDRFEADIEFNMCKFDPKSC